LDELQAISGELRKKGRTVVFTNGCFDLIHSGHVQLLSEAQRRGDCLIVGANTDDSIRRIKGEKRPLLDQGQRGRILASFEAVDYVVFFDGDTPEEIIAKIRPDILVKGGDYEIKGVVGRQTVWDSGGEVSVVKPVEARSTTAIIQDILNRFS